MSAEFTATIRRFAPIGVVLVLIALLVPELFGSLWLAVFTSATVYALSAVGVGVLYGRLGLVSLTNYAILGAGAWFTLRLYHLWHLPFFVNVFLGGLFAALIGTIIGLPALRLRGLYLALVTLLAAGAFSTVITALGFPSGGTGFNGRGGTGNIKPMPRPSIAQSDPAYFRLTVVMATLGFLVVWIHLRTRPGRAWAMIRRSQAAALSAGVNVTLYKTWAFTLAGFLSGIAGGLLAGYLKGSLNVGDFGASASMLLFALTVSAGAYHLFGAALAGLLARALPQVLNQRGINGDLANLIFGFLLMSSLTAAPEGAAGQIIGVAKMLWGKVVGNRGTGGDAAAEASQTAVAPEVVEGHHVDRTVSIKGVTVQFGGVRPLNDLELDLNGRIVGIVGPNGAGKTTLLNVLSGFVTPISGTVTVDGVELLAMNPYERARWGVRRTFQTEQVVDNLTVFENVDVMLDSIAMPAHDRKAAVRAALTVTGLARHEHSLASKLNAYERRMVEITRAIVGSPKLIMMDEPAAGLSEHETKQFQAIMTTLPARTGATILLIDHDVDLIAALCERTAVLDFGQLIAYGSTRDVLDDERVRAAYLGVVDDGELDGALAGAEELL